MTREADNRRKRLEAAAVRRQLIAELGGRCAVCGLTEKLVFHEFEYPYGKSAGGHSRTLLIRRLIKEGKGNAVTVVCKDCHKVIHRQT